MISDHIPKATWFLRSGDPTAVTALLPGDPDPHTVRRDIAAVLHQLGPTAAHVAAALTAAGTRGEPGDAIRCPVGAYLLGAYRSVSDVLVGPDAATHQDWPGGLTDGVTVVIADLPEPVAAFLTEFDAGRWPALIAAPLPSTVEYPGTTGAEAVGG